MKLFVALLVALTAVAMAEDTTAGADQEQAASYYGHYPGYFRGHDYGPYRHHWKRDTTEAEDQEQAASHHYGHYPGYYRGHHYGPYRHHWKRDTSAAEEASTADQDQAASYPYDTNSGLVVGLQ